MASDLLHRVLRLLPGLVGVVLVAWGGGFVPVPSSIRPFPPAADSPNTLVLRAAALAPGPRGCYDPSDFGARPDDGIDDRAPSQQALDAASVAGGRVCFGHGRWRLTRAPVGSHNRFAALSTHGAHVEIQGAGPERCSRWSAIRGVRLPG
jgi:hypothetical protein